MTTWDLIRSQENLSHITQEKITMIGIITYLKMVEKRSKRKCDRVFGNIAWLQKKFLNHKIGQYFLNTLYFLRLTYIFEKLPVRMSVCRWKPFMNCNSDSEWMNIRYYINTETNWYRWNTNSSPFNVMKESVWFVNPLSFWLYLVTF